MEEGILSRDQVADLYAKNPCMRVREVAEEVGISKQRVSQIREQLQMPSLRERFYVRLRCLNCNTEFKMKMSRYRELSKADKKKSHHLTSFCKPECKKAYFNITIKCDNPQCKKFLKRDSRTVISYLKRGQKMMFCNRSCFGQYAGTVHGWGRFKRKGGV